jgi:G protein beta subunit-like protein
VWDAVFSADSLYLVSASSDQSAKLWDLRTGEVARHYSAHNLAVTCVALNDSSEH